MSKIQRKINKVSFPSENNNLNAVYRWQIWMLKTTGNKTSIALFYSWVVPYTASKTGWQPELVEQMDSRVNLARRTIKTDLLRAEYIGTGSAIKNYIDQLLKAVPLNEIINDADMSPVPDGFLNFNLGSDPATVSNSYVIRPEVFLPVEHMLIPWHAKATPSPSDYSLFVSQLVKLNKLEILSFEQTGFDKAIIKRLIKKLSEKMKDETGFDFTKSSAPRTGNIEWFRLPVSDFKLDALVEFECEKSVSGSVNSINVSLAALPSDIMEKEVLVRCRIINGEEVDLDEVKKVNWGNTSQTIRFIPHTPVSEILVTLWEQTQDGNSIVLIEKSSICIRTVNFEMSIIGSTINSGRINLLRKLRGEAEEKKAVALASFSRSTKASSSDIGGYLEDPWVASGREAINYMKVLFPDKSGGHFFLRGWDEAKNTSGQLSFIEWIFEVISAKQQGTLLLIDPFFDQDGIEVFANSRTTNNKYIILTCTQHRVKEKEAATEVSVPKLSGIVDTGELPEDIPNKTIKDLQEKCNVMLPLLNGLELEIRDIRSDGGGKDQLFHDRYIILLDKQGYAFAGYHLSNSIQGATKTAPLLVTPIPADILDEVLGYVENLIEPKNPNPGSRKTSVGIIYPFPISKTENIIADTLDKSQPPVENHPLNENMQDMGYLFSKLHGNILIDSMSQTELANYFIQNRILDEKTGHYKLFNITPEQLSIFARYLNDAGREDFERLWNSYSTLKAHGHSFDHDKIVLNDPNPSELYDSWNELKTVLSSLPNIGEKLWIYMRAFNSDQLLGHRDRQYNILNVESFEEGYRSSALTLDYFEGDNFTMPFSYSDAAKVLTDVFPETALQFLKQLLKEASDGNWNEGDIAVRPRLQILSLIIRTLMRYSKTTDITMLTRLLNDESFTLRALAAAAMKAALFDENRKLGLDTVITKLKETLPDDENRLALAGMIARKHISPDTITSSSWKDSLYENLLADWPDNDELLKRVIIFLSGNLSFNFSDEITERFILPLCKRKSIAPLSGYKVWHEVFIQKVQFRQEYIDNGSASASYNYCSTTDVELTKSLIKIFALLDEQEQVSMLNEWINVTEQLWPQATLPFARHSNYHKFYMAATRIYWLMFILQKLKNDGLFLPIPLQRANEILQKYNSEMLAIDQFINNLHEYSIKDLNNIN